MNRETEVNSAQSSARLLAALLVYAGLGGLMAALIVETTGDPIDSKFFAVLVSGLLCVPLAVLLALKTSKYRQLKPAVQTFAVLAVAGLASWLFTDATSRMAITIVCISFPAFCFAAVWLGPEGNRRRAS